jgi:hypothetical protein
METSVEKSVQAIRELRSQATRIRREQLQINRELIRSKAMEKLDVLTDRILKSENACSILSRLTKSEVKVVADRISSDLDSIIEECEADIAAVKERNMEKAVKRKETMLASGRSSDEDSDDDADDDADDESDDESDE